MLGFGAFFGHMPSPEKPVPDHPLCAIRGKSYDLETCKIDWNGKAVHEQCLVDLIAAKKPVGA